MLTSGGELRQGGQQEPAGYEWPGISIELALGQSDGVQSRSARYI